MTDIAALINRNTVRWNTAKLTRASEFGPVALRLVSGKDKYVEIERATGVPWWVVAVIHEREAGQRWNANIAQGDPWNEVSQHVPAGRGPFGSFKDAAVDALANCAPHAAKWRDWSPGGAMTLLEEYNGLGYAAQGKPSPYVWSGTDQYVSGKYVRDHVYDANAVDEQLGCAGLALAMRQIDPSISFVGAVAVDTSDSPKSAVSPKHVAGTAVVVGAGAAASHAVGLPWWGVLLVVAAVAIVPFIISKIRG